MNVFIKKIAEFFEFPIDKKKFDNCEFKHYNEDYLNDIFRQKLCKKASKTFKVYFKIKAIDDKLFLYISS